MYSCSEGRGFESQHRTLDEHYFLYKLYLFLFEKDRKLTKKVAGDGTFKECPISLNLLNKTDTNYSP